MEGIPKNPLSTTTASLAEDPELVADFVSESREHLGNIESVLLVLEQNPQDPEPVHALFNLRQIGHRAILLTKSTRGGG